MVNMVVDLVWDKTLNGKNLSSMLDLDVFTSFVKYLFISFLVVVGGYHIFVFGRGKGALRKGIEEGIVFPKKASPAKALET